MTQQSNTPATIASIQQFSFFNPEQFATMQRVATMFCNSELVPDMYRVTADNPKEKAIANCIIAIDIANRIGANILMVMQNLVIIYGRPSWSSKFIIATVNTCGRFDTLKYKFNDLGELKDFRYTEYETTWEKVEGKNKKTTKVVNKVLTGITKNIECIAYTSAKGSDEVLESAPISVEMAINEGWYTKKGSKWQSMTVQMLMYRAASFWTSAYAPELSMGMKTEDEIRDIEDVTYEDVTESAKKEQAAKANKKEISITDTEEKKEAAEPKLEEQPSPQPTEEKNEAATAEVKEQPKPKAKPDF